MAISNSVFLNIKDTPPLDGKGWEVRILSYKDFQTTVAVLSNYQNLMVGPMINDVGSGSVSFSMEDSFWDTYLWSGVSARDILNKSYLFQCWEDGVLRFEFIGQRVREDIVNDNEEYKVSISGPGTAATLEWAQVFPPNFPKYNKTVHWYNKYAAMKMYSLLIRAAQKRGTIRFVGLNFDHLKDSSGAAWADLNNPRIYKITYGDNLLDTLNDMTGQNASDPWTVRADWFMRPNFTLDVRQKFGARLETQVIFFEGDIEDKSRDRNREKIKNYVSVSDSAGNYSLVSDTSSRNSWMQREHIDRRDGLTDVKVRKAVANVLLDMLKVEDSEWTITIPYDRPTRRPFRDFGVGDYIGIARFNGASASTVEAFQVRGITVEVTDEKTTCELTLESWNQARQRILERALTRLLHPDPLKSIKVPNGYKVPKTPPMPVIWDPDKGFSADPNYSLGGGGGGVFIQHTDPALNTANNVQTGDLWLQIDS